MKQKLLALILALTLVCTLLTGCGRGKADEEGGKKGTTTDGKTELVLWSVYIDDGVDALYSLVDKFNETSDKYHLTMEYGGSQSQMRQKLATYDKKYYPSLFMCEPAAIYDYENGGYVKPLQDFLDKDSDKWTDDIFDVAKMTYSNKDGKMLGGIMGISVKGYFVNVDMLKAAGYQLEDITSFEKIAEIAQAAYDKGLCKYGYTPYESYEMQNMLCYQGVDILDNDNGFSGDPTKCLLGEGETYASLKKMTEIYSKMSQNGSYYYGAGGVSGASMFINRQLLFWAGTNSYVFNIKDVDLSFEWAFVPLVGVDENAKYKNCAMPEGTGLFIADTGDEAEMQGAYELIKFFAQPENQIEWCTYRGYVPYTNEVANSEGWLTWSAEYFPSSAALMEKIKNTPAELRLPYSPVAAAMNSACSRLSSMMSTDPKGDLDAFIQEITANVNKSINLLKMREK